MEYIDMNINPKRTDSNIDTTYCVITAFYDIGRKNWDADYRRSAETYMNAAQKYFNYDYNMIMFIDERYFNEMNSVYLQSPYQNKTLIPIDEKWLEQYSFVWRQRSNDVQIMKSSNYQSRVQNRINNGYPETRIPYYNVITSCKIDYMMYAVDHHLVDDYDFLCWSDFGYFNSIYGNKPEKFPTNSLDICKFDVTKINMTVLRQIQKQDGDIYYTLSNAPEVLGTSFFASPKHLISTFQKLCHDTLIQFHKLGITDDDQHVYLHPIIKHPELFCLFIDTQKWPEALSFFQK
jgi:hypothetical protein